MSISFDSALGVHASALRIRSQRAELLASNLANADTPNFKARDIDFKSAMAMAASQHNSATLVQTNAKHIQPAQNNALLGSPSVQFRTSVQDSLDGNTVDEQIEQAQFMQNAIQYQASLNFLGGKFKGLLTAIKGE